MPLLMEQQSRADQLRHRLQGVLLDSKKKEPTPAEQLRQRLNKILQSKRQPQDWQKGVQEALKYQEQQRIPTTAETLANIESTQVGLQQWGAAELAEQAEESQRLYKGMLRESPILESRLAEEGVPTSQWEFWKNMGEGGRGMTPREYTEGLSERAIRAQETERYLRDIPDWKKGAYILGESFLNTVEYLMPFAFFDKRMITKPEDEEIYHQLMAEVDAESWQETAYNLQFKPLQTRAAWLARIIEYSPLFLGAFAGRGRGKPRAVTRHSVADIKAMKSIANYRDLVMTEKGWNQLRSAQNHLTRRNITLRDSINKFGDKAKFAADTQEIIKNSMRQAREQTRLQPKRPLGRQRTVEAEMQRGKELVAKPGAKEAGLTEAYWQGQKRKVPGGAKETAQYWAQQRRISGKAMVVGKEDVLELVQLLKKGVRSLEGITTLKGHSAIDTIRYAVRSGQVDKLLRNKQIDQTTYNRITGAAAKIEANLVKEMLGESARTAKYWQQQKPYQSKVPIGELTKDMVKLPDADVEGFFVRTKRFQDSVQSKLRAAANRISRYYKQRFYYTPFVPRGKEFAYARDAVRTMPEKRIYARNQSIMDVGDILTELDPVQFEIFVKKIFTEDLIADAASGRTLPKGLTRGNLQRSKIYIDRIMEDSPTVQQAYQKRMNLWREVSWDLHERGYISAEAARNPTYVRHFVLDYLDAEYLGGGISGKFRKPYRPYTKTRYGTTKDISTDYVEVELKALGDIYAHNSVEDTAIGIAERYAVSAEEALHTPGYIEWMYKRPVTRHRAQTKTGHDIAAANEVFWSELNIGDELKITNSVAKEALAPGPKTQVLYIPEWLAKQLDNLPIHQPAIVDDSLRKLFVQGLKKWYIRSNPIRYNLRNFLGDAERVNAAGYTKAFLRMYEAVIALIKKESPPQHPEAYQKAIEYGGAGTSLWHELGKSRLLPEFKRFADITDYSTFKKVARTMFRPGHGAKLGLRFAENWTQFREDILRYAVYLEALDRVDVFLKTGKPIKHWAGGKQGSQDVQVLAKIDKYRAAAKIARETLGDYGKFTPWENNALRNGLMPFYSWLKINTAFWPRAFTGALKEGEIGKAGSVMALKIPLSAMGMGFRLGKFATRVGLAYTALYAWNHKDERFSNYENALPAWQKVRPHLIIPNLQDVPAGVVWQPSALSDFTEWFGLDDIAPDMKRFEAGQITFDELMMNSAQYAVRAPVNRIWQQLFSPIKATVTTISGYKTFPDVFEPQMIVKGGTKDALLKALVDMGGSDLRRFVDAYAGKITWKEALSYYLTAGAIRGMTEEELIAQLRIALMKTTKEKPTLPEMPPKPQILPPLGAQRFPRKGKEREVEMLRNRLDAILKEKKGA